MLREFWQKHPEAEQVLRDYVPPYTIFDIGGNNYRLVVIVRYRFKKVFVHKVMTHREYDDWNKLYRKGKE
jgi:mRNA interferase HigB